MRRSLLLVLALLAVLTPATPAAAQAELDHDRDQERIYRLYQAYFGRAPDAAGFWFWADRVAEGQSLADISDHFAESPEFVDLYGPLDDGAFVDQVYRSVFDRLPDEGGRAYWVARMEAGLRRGEVMLAFSDSTEYQVQLGFVSQPAIERLYRAVFLRDADAVGLRFWLDRAGSGMSLIEIATAMVSSPEFETRYGSLGDASFVEQIYRNVLDRGPDAEGEAFWGEQLGLGVPRGTVVSAFSESEEYQRQTGLIDPVAPSMPARPGTELPPIAWPAVWFLVPQPPYPLPGSPSDGGCDFTAEAVHSEPVDATTFALHLTFNYPHTLACHRSLGLEGGIDGPGAREWELVSGTYSTSDRYGVWGALTFHVPRSLVDDTTNELPGSVWVRTADGRLEWNGPFLIDLDG